MTDDRFVPQRNPNRSDALRAALAAACTLAAAGCGGGGGSVGGGGGGTAPTPTPTPHASGGNQPVPTGTITPASLTVTPTIMGSVGPRFVGLSYEKGVLSLSSTHFTPANADLIGLFQRLGPSVLRLGGDSVDQNVWNAAGSGQTKGQFAPADVNALAAFLKACGWQCLYGVNLGGAGPNPYTSGTMVASTTPALAAAEIAYVYEALGDSLFGFEIGNEPDLYGTSYFAGSTWNVSTFQTLWEQFRSAIVTQTPAVAGLCTGPATAGNESTWTVPFGEAVTSSALSLLTQHYYRGSGSASPEPTAQDLLAYDPTLVGDLAILKAGAQAITPSPVPFRITECNSYSNGGAPGISDSYASALWSIDFFFNCAAGGATGANFHGGGESPGYTPIADSNGSVVQIRPEFYGLVFVTLAGTGSLYTTQFSGTTDVSLFAYAVKTATGLNLVVVNADPSQNFLLTIAVPTTVHAATLLEMTQLSTGATAPNVLATAGVTIGGASIDLNGGFTPAAPYVLATGASTVKCYAPFSSAVLIAIT